MDILTIEGGKTLNGSLAVQGAKNSALPILAATILAAGECVIHNCPHLSDVDAAIQILKYLGCTVKREGTTVTVDSSTLNKCDIPDNLMREMRSSVIFLGAILGRCGRAEISYPGGCELGPRPIDLHMEALRTLGAEICESSGKILCSAQKMQGAKIRFSLPSVGATENAMLAACMSSGSTTIMNAACEPEIEDLQLFLRKLGVRVNGAGTPVVQVEGGIRIRNCEHTVMPDRIVASTYLSAAAAAGGDIELHNVIPEHFKTVTDVLDEAGCKIDVGNGRVRIRSNGRLSAVKTVVTKPYPGFPTDAQPPLMAAMLCAAGTTVFVENIFENRFRHAAELRRMGARISTEGKVAIVTGVGRLHGCAMEAIDLRGGAALAVAALTAQGKSMISGVRHIDRGYDNIENDLGALGAQITRSTD